MAKAAGYERHAYTITDPELRKKALLAAPAEARAMAPVIPRRDAEDARKDGEDTQRRQALLKAAEYDRKAATVFHRLDPDRREWLLAKAAECRAEAGAALANN